MEQDCTGGLAPAERQIEAGGLKWNYLEWQPAARQNSGLNIVLLHGITSDAYGWWRVGAALALQGARVLAPDMPGHGRTGDSPDGLEWLTTARQVAAWLRALGLPDAKYRLAGHSWGGAVSLTLATEEPAGLERVALLDPSLSLNPQRVQPAGEEYNSLVGQPKKSWQEYYEWAQTNQPDWTPCDHHWKAGAMLAFRPEAPRDFYWHNSGQNAVPRLAKVEVPLLLLVGDEQAGGVISLETQAAAQVALREGLGRLVKLPGIGHNLHRQDYATTVQHLKPFMLG